MIELPEIPEAIKYLLLILSYGMLGASIKYIDQAFDAGVFSRKIATILAVPSAMLMGALMVLDSTSATIFLAVVLGVAVTQKIDTFAFKLAVLILILVPVIFRQVIEIQWVAFGLLVIAGIGDEYGNDWADLKLNGNGNKKKRKSLIQTIFNKLLLQRPFMKLLILILTVTAFFHPVYILAFLTFDVCYSLVAWISVHTKTYRISTIPTKDKPTRAQRKKGLNSLPKLS